MHKWTTAIVFILGVSLGVLGYEITAARGANTAAVPFKAVAVSASATNGLSISWFVGQDGAARMCEVYGGGGSQPTCSRVPL
jgi:hypothetical protein